jgi:DNA-binding transcriptional LysR family regulator
MVAAVRGLLRGRLAIGLVQSLGLVDLPALVTRFHRRHPAVTLRLHNDAVPELVRATVEGELDIAFVDRPLDDRLVRAVPLGVEPVMLAVAAGDPLADRDRVPLVELADRDFVEYRADSALRARVDANCAAVGLRRRMCCEVDTIADLVELVAGGLGVALLPPRALRPAAGRVIGLPTDPVISRELAVVTAADRPPAPAAAALLAMLTESRPA